MEYDKKTENHGKWETSTWHLKNDEIIEKLEKWEMHTLGHEIWQGNWKGGKFRNVHCRTWNMARKPKIIYNEKHPLDDFKNDKITEKREKWEMYTCRTWNMATKVKIRENENNTH